MPGRSEALRQLWSDPEFRRRQLEAIARGRTQEAEARRVEALREAVRRPEVRERQRVAQRLAWEERRKAKRDRAEERQVYVPKRRYGAGRQWQVRPCLCCGNSFRSEGPHNRLCSTCRARSSSPFEP